MDRKETALKQVSIWQNLRNTTIVANPKTTVTETLAILVNSPPKKVTK